MEPILPELISTSKSLAWTLRKCCSIQTWCSTILEHIRLPLKHPISQNSPYFACLLEACHLFCIEGTFVLALYLNLKIACWAKIPKPPKILHIIHHQWFNTRPRWMSSLLLFWRQFCVIYSEKLDVEDHYVAWRQAHDDPRHSAGTEGPFSFCSYPFLLSPRAKSKLLHVEARFNMTQV